MQTKLHDRQYLDILKKRNDWKHYDGSMPTAIWAHPILNTTDKCLLALLTTYQPHNQKTKLVWPSIKTLCVLSNLSNKTVICSLEVLTYIGFIMKHKRYNQTTKYSLNFYPDFNSNKTRKEIIVTIAKQKLELQLKQVGNIKPLINKILNNVQNESQ